MRRRLGAIAHAQQHRRRVGLDDRGPVHDLPRRERVEGVDYVSQLDLRLDGIPQGERARIADGATVVAGVIRVKVVI